jgi:hypothetical protein
VDGVVVGVVRAVAELLRAVEARAVEISRLQTSYNGQSRARKRGFAVL